MNCPVCGSTLELVEKRNFCPNCKIFVGEARSDFLGDPSEEETPAEVFQKRNRSSFIKRVIAIVFVLAILSSTGVFFVLNFTSFGYREQIFYRYNFTPEARSYLREKTSINILFPQEKKPFGFQHAGYWSSDGKKLNKVHLNSANDEVAIHEFGHAWYDKLTRVDKNPGFRKSLVEDTIRLSQLTDERYSQATEQAKAIVQEHCNCNSTASVDLTKVDDHHFYAYMVQFLMGQFKSGSHKLPEFMWSYFESMFESQPRVTPCYETNSCYTGGSSSRQVE